MDSGKRYDIVVVSCDVEKENNKTKSELKVQDGKRKDNNDIIINNGNLNIATFNAINADSYVLDGETIVPIRDDIKTKFNSNEKISRRPTEYARNIRNSLGNER